MSGAQEHVAIHAISLIKNEADIIQANLTAALRWCDHIYVFDNGSRDGTWEKVQELAQQFPAIVPWKQDGKPFRDGLRAEVLRHFKNRAAAGDWWCILDADEFYVDNPAEFLAQVPDCYQSVWPQLYTYLFTDKDAEEYARDRRGYEEAPAPERLRYYVLGQYSEPRFVRHTREFVRHAAWRRHPIYPRRIRIRHYGYRSPQQIGLRLQTRLEPMLRGEFVHEKRSNWQPDGFSLPGPAAPSDLPGGWKERIVPSTDCHFDTGDDSLVAPCPWEPDMLILPPPPPHNAAVGLRRLATLARRHLVKPVVRYSLGVQ